MPDADFILAQADSIEELEMGAHRIARKVELWPGVIAALREVRDERDRLLGIISEVGWPQ